MPKIVVNNTAQSELQAFLLKADKLIMDAIKDTLAAIVAEGVTEARERPFDESFYNVTGNLRSSIGGAVYERGQVYFMTEFATVLEGSTGSAEGRNLVLNLAQQYAQAVGATMVAAMPYAEEVEARESKDVLETVRIKAQAVVEKRVSEAVQKAMREIQQGL